MTVISKAAAWKKVDEIFPTDYAKDEESSSRVGYPIYRSTTENHYYDYICDLGCRLEVNLLSGETINIWIEEPEEVTELKKEVERLKAALEKEQGWALYESERNVKQTEYDELVRLIPNGAHYMTDDEAKDWICGEFDFDRDKITIIHEIDEEEKNRNNQCRHTGRKIDRRPVYCATDYHYIRFNTSRWYYEVWNDTLRPFYC